MNSKKFTRLRTIIPLRKMLLLLAVCAVSCHSQFNSSEESTNKEIEDKVTVNHKELRKVRFLPYWVIGTQFAGYYVGLEKGIYEKYGIQLEIIPFQPFVTTTNLIKEGKADFAALWLVNALELRASGTDIVNIAQPSSRSSLMLITKKKSGIDQLEKMNGKKMGIWSGYELQPKALFSKYNLDVQIVSIGSTDNLFLMDGVDITAANWFDEYHSIINSGIDADELNTFFFADYGLNFLEDGIYCLSGMLENDPELCLDFVNATFAGWEYALNHTDESIEIMMRICHEANMPVNRVHQRWVLDRYRDSYFPKGSKKFNTKLSRADYIVVSNVLKDGHLINEIPDFDSFYKPVLISE